MRGLGAVLKIAYIAALLCAALLLFARPLKLESGIFEMADSGDSDRALSKILKKNSSKLRLVVSGKSEDAVEAFAERAAQILGEENIRKFSLDSGELKKLKAVFLAHRDHLLSTSDSALLEKGGDEEIFKRAKERILSPYALGIFKVSEDPFFTLANFAEELMAQSGGGWKARGGFLRRLDGESTLQIAMIADCENISDSRFGKILGELDQLKSEAQKSGVQVLFGGARVHSHYSALEAERDINILSAASLILVLALGFWAFGSFKIFIPVLLALSCSFALASAAAFLVFERPHAAVFIFATSLIGLSIDYSYHFFAASKSAGFGGALEKIKSPLRNSFLTTLICFLMLGLSDLALLRQISLFSSVGLISMYFFVALFYPPICAALKPNLQFKTLAFRPLPKWVRRGLLSLCVLFALAGIFISKFGTDLSDLYAPDEKLLQSDVELAKIFGDADSSFLILKGKTLDELSRLERESGVAKISLLLPDKERQLINRQALEKLYLNYASKLSESVGTKREFKLNADSKPISLEDYEGTLAAELLNSMLVKTPSGYTAIVPLEGASKLKSELPRGAEKLGARDFVNRAFDSYLDSALRVLALCFFAVCLFFAAIFKRSIFRLIAPIALSAGLVLFFLCLLGSSVNLFHVLAFYILAGIGIDYAIFHLSSPSLETRSAVFLSFLTSFIGFAALIFTPFSAVSSMGFVLAVGLAGTYAISLLIKPCDA